LLFKRAADKQGNRYANSTRALNCGG